MPVDKFGRLSDAKTRDTGVSLTYINNNYVRSDGSTPVTGSIDMKGNSLNKVGDPINPQDVATKDYVDYVKTVLNESLNNIDKTKKHIIAVSTYHSGDLIKGEYQFTFGGNKCEKSGFLMPQSGRIKRIKVRLTGGLFGEIEGGEERMLIHYVENLPFEEAIREGSFLIGDLFSIILFKGGINPNPIGSFFEHYDRLISNPVGSIMSTYKCIIVTDVDDNFTRKCNLNFDHDLKNYPLSEGDIINIRTEKKFRKQKTNFRIFLPF